MSQKDATVLLEIELLLKPTVLFIHLQQGNELLDYVIMHFIQFCQKKSRPYNTVHKMAGISNTSFQGL